MGHELKQKPVPVDEGSSNSDQEQEELGEGLLLESSDNPWMKHVSYIILENLTLLLLGSY